MVREVADEFGVTYLPLQERQVDYLRQGLRLTTDTIHQNTAGAGLIAGLIEDFVAAASEE